MILARANGLARIGAVGYPRASGVAYVEPAGDIYDPGIYDPGIYASPFNGRTAFGLATIPVSVAELVRPRLTRAAGQGVGPFRVYTVDPSFIGRTPLSLQSITVGTYVEDGPSGTTWSFGFIYLNTSEPVYWLGTQEPIEIDAILFGTLPGAPSPLTVPLIVGGKVDNIANTFQPSGSGGVQIASGIFTVTGVDGRGLYDRNLATIVFPPGHGQQRGVVARRILQAAGVPLNRIAIDGGANMYKGVDLVDQPGIASANEILGAELREIYCDPRDGVFKARLMGYDPDAPYQWVFGIQDIIVNPGGPPTVGVALDGPGSITITGTKQVLRPDAGNHTVSTSVKSYSTKVPVVAAFRQAGDGSLSAVSATADATLKLVSVVLRDVEYDGDSVVSERVRTYGFFNPVTWRYTLAADGSISGYNTGAYVLEPSAVAGDGFGARVWDAERFVLISDQLTAKTFDSRGFLVQEIVTLGGWNIPITHLKHRSSPSATWESTNYESNVKVLSLGGNGVTGPQAWTDLLKRITTNITVSDDPAIQPDSLGITSAAIGYVLGTLASTEEYRITGPGTGYLYSGPQESSDPSMIFGFNGSIETVYAALPSDSSHSESVRTRDAKGNIVDQVDSTGLGGYLPAAERNLSIIPSDATYDDAQQASFAAAASRYEQQAIKTEFGVASGDLAGIIIPGYQVKLNNDWIETPEEGEAKALFELREMTKAQVSFGLPLNPFVRRRHKVRLSIPDAGWEMDLFVDKVRHQEQDVSGRTVAWTQVTADLYAV